MFEKFHKIRLTENLGGRRRVLSGGPDTWFDRKFSIIGINEVFILFTEARFV